MDSPEAAIRQRLAEQRFILVHDSRFAAEAEWLGRLFVLETIDLTQLSDYRGMGPRQLIVYLDLQDFETAKAFRDRIGTPPAPREWAFIRPIRAARLWQVQADALGATAHVSRDDAPLELRQLLSIAARAPLSGAQVTRLKAERQGETIVDAGRELAELFAGFTSGEPISVGRISALGMEIIGSIGAGGAQQWLGTVRNYHEGTFQHCLLVAGVVASYVNRYMPGSADAQLLTQAALLHDIGKAVVPVHILDKPGALTDEEFAVVKLHPAAGYDYLAGQPDMDANVLDAVRHHHEALDGSGYPDGLGGAEIRPLTRILTVCDIFAAMIEQRAYKRAHSPEEAVSILVALALDGKVDYRPVRRLAEVFDMHPPETIAQVRRNLSAVRRAGA